jgi:cytoskeleton protein RodZ
MATLLAKDAMAGAAAAAPPLTGAGRVGAELRDARLRLGWTLPDVANSLRIRLPYLDAIEAGRVADLPGSAYAVGFVRAYAASLGLDADAIARRFRTEAIEVNRKPELAFPAPVPERGVPAGAVILVGAVIAGLAYAAWFRFGGDAPRAAVDAVPPVPAHLEALAGPPPAPPSTTSPQVASVMPDKPVPPAASPPAAPASAPVQPPSAPTPALTAAPLTVQPTTPAPPQSTAGTPALASPAATAPVLPATSTAPGGTQIVVQATADAWVQVRQKNGRVLLNRVLRSGETWPVPDEPNLVLTTGNAGGTELLVDGQPAPSLGKSGAVRRDLPLDPAALAQGGTSPPSSPATSTQRPAPQ